METTKKPLSGYQGRKRRNEKRIALGLIAELRRARVAAGLMDADTPWVPGTGKETNHG